jgi:hypothetical protein
VLLFRLRSEVVRIYRAVKTVRGDRCRLGKWTISSTSEQHPSRELPFAANDAQDAQWSSASGVWGLGWTVCLPVQRCDEESWRGSR